MKPVGAGREGPPAEVEAVETASVRREGAVVPRESGAAEGSRLGRGPTPGATLLGLLPEVLFAAAAAYLFVLARTFQYEPQPDRLGPGFWPQVLCVGILACAVVRVVHKLRAARTGEAPVAPAPDVATGAEDVPVERWRLGLGVALVVGYVLGTVFLGYILATAIFFVAFVYLGGQRRWFVVPVGVAVSLALAFVFLKVVYVSLPSGVGVFDRLSVVIYQVLGIY